MTAIITEIPAHIPGDAWAHFTAANHPEQAQELESLVQQYLDQGGTITELPACVSGTPVPAGVVAQLAISKFTVEEHLAHDAKRVVKASKRDLALAEKIRALLPADSRNALVTALRSSHDRITAVIKAHLSDNPDAMALLEPRCNREAVLAKVQQAIAEGVVGYYNICEYADVSYATLKKMEKLHRLAITPNLSGFRQKEQNQ